MEIASPDSYVSKRRCSLFTLKRIDSDIGESVMIHAHRPRARSSSLSIVKPSIFSKLFGKKLLQDIMKDVLDKGLKGKLYDENECVKQNCDLTRAIKSRIVDLNVPHFKFIVTCHVARNFDSSIMNIQSSCVWDQDRTSVHRDIFAEYVFKNDEILAVGNVHGIYTRGFNKSIFR